MRTVYRLLGLARSYRPDAVDAACARALELDVVDVTKVARMLEQARERQPLPTPVGKVVGGPARFAREAQSSRQNSRSASRQASHEPASAPAPPLPASAASVDADLKALLRKVKLGRIPDTLPERIALARDEQLPHADFLTLVLADEVDRRDRASAELRARTAKLDLSMRLETFTSQGTARFDRELRN